jgi:hypothetical protein
MLRQATPLSPEHSIQESLSSESYDSWSSYDSPSYPSPEESVTSERPSKDKTPKLKNRILNFFHCTQY